MLGPVLIILGVLATCAALAFVGARIGAKNEAPNLAAGMTEQSLRGGLTPSVMGGLLGVIPFVIFVVILVVQAIQTGAEEARREAAEAAEAARERDGVAAAGAARDVDGPCTSVAEATTSQLAARALKARMASTSSIGRASTTVLDALGPRPSMLWSVRRCIAPGLCAIVRAAAESASAA